MKRLTVLMILICLLFISVSLYSSYSFFADTGQVKGNILSTDTNGNEIIDLDDLAPTDLGVDHSLAMAVLFNPVQTVAEHQGDSATTTLTVTLNQDSSQ